MKSIKKLSAAMLAAILCLSFAACNKKTENSPPIKTETPKPQQEVQAEIQDTSLLTITSGKNKNVSIGDSKEAVINALGKPVNERAYALEYEGLTVYLSENVNMITIKDKGYTGYKKAAIGMSIDEYRDSLDATEYTLEEQKDIGFYRITISADADGNVVKSADEGVCSFIVTSNNYGAESTITHIQLKELGV